MRARGNTRPRPDAYRKWGVCACAILLIAHEHPRQRGQPSHHKAFIDVGHDVARPIDFAKGVNGYGWDCTTCVSAGIQRMTASILNTDGG